MVQANKVKPFKIFEREKIYYAVVVGASGGTGIRNPDFEYPQYRGELGLSRLFFNLCKNFAIFDEFSKFYSVLSACTPIHFEKSSNVAKILQRKLKKSLVQLAVSSFFN